MLFFLFRKSYVFQLFLFSKKFIISYEKNRKTNNLNFKNKLFLAKSQKNKHHISLQHKLLLFVIRKKELVFSRRRNMHWNKYKRQKSAKGKDNNYSIIVHYMLLILIKWCIICSLFWRTASAKNLKISSNNQMTKVRAMNLLIMLEGILHYFSHIYRILVQYLNLLMMLTEYRTYFVVFLIPTKMLINEFFLGNQTEMRVLGKS